MKLIDPIFNRTKTGFITINHHKILFSMKNAQNIVSREDVKWENDACWWRVQVLTKVRKKTSPLVLNQVQYHDFQWRSVFSVTLEFAFLGGRLRITLFGHPFFLL